MQFKCEFDMDNAAFDGRRQAEVGRIFRTINKRIDDGIDSGKILDINGNTVGKWEMATDANMRVIDFQCPDCEQIFEANENTLTCPHCGEGILVGTEV